MPSEQEPGRRALPTPYRDMLDAARRDIFLHWKAVAFAAVALALAFLLTSCAAHRDTRHPCQDTNTCEVKR